MGNATWKVLPHRPIEKLTENLWRVEGDLEGMPLKRVMTLVKRSNGELLVHNAIALEEPAMKEIDAWGKVSAVVVPNGFHRLDAGAYAERYPNALFYCPEGARKKVEQVVQVHGTYEDFPADAAISLETLDGLAKGEGVLTVKSSDGSTVVLNDAVFNMPHVDGFTGFVFRHVTRSSGGPRVSRIGKLFLVKDKAAFRAHLERLAETPALTRVIVSHHQMITDHPADAIRAAAATV